MARGAKILRARRNFARLRVVVGWRNFMFLKKSSDFFSYFVLAFVCASAQPRLHPFVAIVIFLWRFRFATSPRTTTPSDSLTLVIHRG